MNFQICLSRFSDMITGIVSSIFQENFWYTNANFLKAETISHILGLIVCGADYLHIYSEKYLYLRGESDAHLRSDEQGRAYFLILLFFFTCSGQLKSDLVSYSLWLIEWQTFDVKICWLVPQDFNNETIGFFPICIACFLFCFWVKKHFTSLCVWSVALDSINKKMMRFSSFLINWMKWYDHLLCFHTSC